MSTYYADAQWQPGLMVETTSPQAGRAEQQVSTAQVPSAQEDGRRSSPADQPATRAGR